MTSNLGQPPGLFSNLSRKSAFLQCTASPIVSAHWSDWIMCLCLKRPLRLQGLVLLLTGS